MKNLYKFKQIPVLKAGKISIIGSGIVGLITATLIKKLIPTADINIYDAGDDPRKSSLLVGTTFGQGKDARHFTGSESLSYQNPVHSRALRLAPGEHRDWAGWRVISENKLTNNERRWRSESAGRFVSVGHENINEYDDLHAQFNYAGMAAWGILERQFPYLLKYKISDGPISIFFLAKNNFEDDLESEASFLNKFGNSHNSVIARPSIDYSSKFKQLIGKGLIYHKSLQLLGSTWRIKSLGIKLLNELEKSGVIFNWNRKIVDSKQILDRLIIWTVGTTHSLPSIYKEHSLIQGIAGCWVTIPNTGFKEPFKISLPQPSGYINITPEGNVLHISGGFGWVGERPYHEAIKLMDPICNHFREQITKYFGIRAEDMVSKGRFPVSICIRPSTPTGLPDVRVVNVNIQKNIILTGSGKSGSTQAPILGLYALSEIDPNVINHYATNFKINNALRSLGSLHKVHKFGNFIYYPQVLEDDLFGVKKRFKK